MRRADALYSIMHGLVTLMVLCDVLLYDVFSRDDARVKYPTWAVCVSVDQVAWFTTFDDPSTGAKFKSMNKF